MYRAELPEAGFIDPSMVNASVTPMRPVAPSSGRAPDGLGQRRGVMGPLQVSRVDSVDDSLNPLSDMSVASTTERLC